MSSPSSLASTKRKTPPPMVDEDGFTKVPTREEKRKQRKVDKHRPQFQYNTQDFRHGKKVGIAHIRDLVLYIVAEAQKPNWMQIEHKTFITHTVVLFTPGLLPAHLGLAPIPTISCMPFSTTPPTDATFDLPPARVSIIPKLFTYACPTRAPGDNRKMHSVLNTLLLSPLPDSIRKKKEAENKQLAALSRADDTPPFLFLLSTHQMIDNDYHLPSYLSLSDTPYIPGLDVKSLPPGLASALSGPSGGVSDVHMDIGLVSTGTTSMNGNRGKGNRRDDLWVETAEAQGPPEDGKYPVLAMDCEMVVSEDGQELARVSVIDYETGKNVFDELVKPPKSIIDYRTQWSGITPERLSTATHTLLSIQIALVTGSNPLITSHTILLGHSLECDLIALRIRHPLCIDTALIYKHPRGPPFKPGLKWLAQKWLNRDIQGGDSGHDSEEDARTCVDLLRLKVAHGPDFGNALENMEPIFERLNRYTSDRTKPGKTSAYCDYGNPRAMYGAKATTAVRCTTDDEVIHRMKENMESHDFVFGRMMELATVQGWNDRGAAVNTSLDPDALEPALERFNARLADLHSSLPSNTAFVLLTGHSDPLPMLALVQRRQKWERMVKTLGGTDAIPKEERWMSEDERELERAVGEAREGMAFFCIKS
ncbi:hypothetical protein IAR55_005797 [Kwoniella newhampshirensis]|uniref:Exonuclease domain-containing protein n=1 Tax=Kwoniella newhampshirensis TaxID=1651941 RepID=A0AAW0YG86_9TREE